MSAHSSQDRDGERGVVLSVPRSSGAAHPQGMTSTAPETTPQQTPRERFTSTVVTISVIGALLIAGFIGSVIGTQERIAGEEQLRAAAASAVAYGAAHDDTWAPDRDTLIAWVADEQVKPSWDPYLASAADLAEVEYDVTPELGATITVTTDSVLGDVTRTWSSVDGS